jgi:SPP1 gp7 family putative phage head morphogenesis protein
LTDAQLADLYIRRGLALVRVANGMSARVDAQIMRLAADVRYLLSRGSLSDLGRRALNALLSDLADAVYQRYNAIIERQRTDLAELIDAEAEFAQKAGTHNNKPSPATLAGVLSGLLILGTSLKDFWMKLAGDVLFRLSADVKASQRAEDANAAAIAAIFGQGRGPGPGKGGDIGTARRAAEAATHTIAQAASSDARMAAFKANGVKYVEWHAILDSKVCPLCAMRAGKLYTVDGKPVGHDIPYQAIPLHPWDRCILLPHSGEPPADGGPGVDDFDEWLGTLSADEENHLLGKGRADLYRRGVITLRDLIDQSGQMLTLAELRTRT